MISRENFSLILQDYLEQRGISVSELAAKMTESGVKTSYLQAYRWSHNKSLPNALQLIAICNVLDIRHVPLIFSEKTVKQIHKKQLAKNSSIDEPSTQSISDHEKNDNIVRISDRQLPVILQKASAGLGQYIDDADVEMVYVREDVPANASFGIHISGDSMEPSYHDGDLVWVERSDRLNSGEIGVFYLDGNVYIKRLSYDKDGAALISLSSKYRPIPIKEDSVFTVWGKVLS